MFDDRVLYTAERKEPKRQVNLARRLYREGKDGLEGYEYRPPLGSLFKGRRDPSTFLLCFNLGSEQRPSLYQISPESVSGWVGERQLLREALLGQAIFSASGQHIMLTAYPPLQDGRRLGLSACTNRPSAIFRIMVDVSNDTEEVTRGLHDDCGTSVSLYTWRPSKWQQLSRSSFSGRSPTLGPDHTCLWLESESGGAHRDCDSLWSWHESEYHNQTLTCQIPFQTLPDRTSKWPGLFADRLSRCCALAAFNALALTTIWGSRRTIVVHPAIQEGRVIEVTPLGLSVDAAVGKSSGAEAEQSCDDGHELWSYTLLCTDGQSLLMATRSSPSRPQQVLLGRAQANGNVKWALVRDVGADWGNSMRESRRLYLL